MIELNPAAHALRPVRIVGDAFRFYEATTFPKNPWAGCEMYLRRCNFLGWLKEDGSKIVLDVLDRNGDIIQDFPLTRDGLRYLRSHLRFKVEKR